MNMENKCFTCEGSGKIIGSHIGDPIQDCPACTDEDEGLRRAVNRNRHNIGLPPQLKPDNRIYRENRTISQSYGDIRQTLDQWLNAAELPDAAEWCIKDVQDALEALSKYVP